MLQCFATRFFDRGGWIVDQRETENTKMRHSNLLITASVCATILTAVTMVARGGNLNPATGPVSPTMLTLTDLAALATPATQGTGNNYFPTTDGLVDPASIPIGGANDGLTMYGNSAAIPGSSPVFGREGQFLIDSIQEQYANTTARFETRVLRLRIQYDQSLIAFLNLMQAGSTVDMIIEVEAIAPGSGIPEVRESIAITRATIVNITASPDRISYIVELQPLTFTKTYLATDGTIHVFSGP
jgi:hypothetical protein